MIDSIKNLIRSIIPKSIFKVLQPIYHGAMALTAAQIYGWPSRDLFVIGVTGTAGKSTTVMMLSHIMNQAGFKTGYLTTVGTFDGANATLNKHGLSMPSGWLIQEALHRFHINGCKFVIVEATSEGLAQNRHLGINFQMALFTNLSPAHLDSHGSFDAYRAAKGKLFSSLTSNGIIGVNADDPNFQFFANFPARKKFGTSTREDRTVQTELPIIKAGDIKVSDNLEFKIENVSFQLNLKGSFNIANALLAIEAARYLGVPLEQSAGALKTFGTIPGRMETIANNKNLTIIVDYAPEPQAMEQSLRAASLVDHNKLIHVFGSTGGHRDKAKRFEFGKISGQFADKIIITNDDVYDSDPEEIARSVQAGVEQASPKKVQQVEIILDRKTAIETAIKTAEPHDLILITGKGSEQFLVLPNNQRISWDDRAVIKEILTNL